MLRAALQSTVEAAVATLVREGRLPAAVADVPVEISDTKSPDHGDYACNLALTASKKAGMNPRALGEMLREELIADRGSRIAESLESIRDPRSAIRDIDVAGPGFLNLRLHPEAVAAYVAKILAVENLAHVENPNPQRINVEFVSVNPNGPITIGSGRGAAFGSALCNVLEAAGNVVHREYYINDGVNSEQMRLFAMSARHHARVRAGYESNHETPSRWFRWMTIRYNLSTTILQKSGVPQAVESRQYWMNLPHDDLKAQVKTLLEVEETDPLRGDNKRAVVPDALESEAPFVWGDELDQLTEDVLRFLLWFNQDWLEPFPEKGYKGQYVIDVASDIIDLYGLDSAQQPASWWQSKSQDLMIKRQRGDLDAFGVTFDTWFSEQSLHDQGIVANRIEGLKQTGVADEEPYRTKLKLGKGGVVEETLREDQPNEDEGEEESGTTHDPLPTTHQNTLWLRSTKFGDDMDRVLRRRDGRLTYIASDVSYHENKLTRPENATKMITILGPDHHGYIGRLTAVVAALLRGPEDTPEANAAALATAKERLEVVIYQLVRFLKDGKPAPMRKRDGNIYELRDLLDELGKNLAPDGTKDEQRTVGRDVARFFYLMRSHDTTMDFDIDLATQQSDENPVFYAQYAHARIASVLRKAEGIADRGSRIADLEDDPSAIRDPRSAISLLTHPRETALIKKILDLPWEVERVAKDYGVHRLTTYAVELARTYHHFYDACRVLQEDQPELTQARLDLCRAAKKALKSTFDLLGVSAPERLDRREPVS